MVRKIHTLFFLFSLLFAAALNLRAQSNELPSLNPYGKTIREIRIQGLRYTQESVVRAKEGRGVP